MRNTELEKLDGLVGEWTTTISDAWFLDLQAPRCRARQSSSGWGVVPGRAHGVLRDKHAHSQMHLVLGRSDPNDAYVALSHDDRECAASSP